MAGSDLTSVVIVAADSGPLLLDAIASALASSAGVEIIVVDNGSRDGEVERARAIHGADARVRILANGRNIGFGPACNRGAAAARGDAFVFLNPDCIIDPHVIAGLRQVMRSHPRAGLAGIEIVDATGRPARGNRRRDPTLRRVLATVSGLARRSRADGVEMAPSDAAADVEVVEAVSGALMFLPRVAFEAIGGFDEAYFLHVEDLDLCRRIRDSGRDVLFARDLRATHRQGSSSRHRPFFVEWHKHRGMWRYFRAHDPAARSRVVRTLVAVGLGLHFAAIAPRLGWRLLSSRRARSGNG